MSKNDPSLPKATYERYPHKVLPERIRRFLKTLKDYKIPRMNAEREAGAQIAVVQHLDIEDWTREDWTPLRYAETTGDTRILVVGFYVEHRGAVKMAFSIGAELVEDRYTYFPPHIILENGYIPAKKWNTYYPDFPVVAVEYSEPYVTACTRSYGDAGEGVFVGFLTGVQDAEFSIAAEMNRADPRVRPGLHTEEDPPIDVRAGVRHGRKIPWRLLKRIDVLGLDKWKPK